MKKIIQNGQKLTLILAQNFDSFFCLYCKKEVTFV